MGDPKRTIVSEGLEVANTSPETPPLSSEHASLYDLVAVVFRYRILITVTFLVAFGATTLWLWLRRDRFEASSKVLIRFGREMFGPRSSVSLGTAKLETSTRPDLATETELVKSSALIDQVVTFLHLDEPRPPEKPPQRTVPWIRFELRSGLDWIQSSADEIQYALALKERPSRRELAILTIQEGLTVESAKESSVLEIKFTTIYKDSAAPLLNTLVDFYRRKRLLIEEAGEGDIFGKQAGEQRKNLLAKEQALQALKQRDEIFANLPDQIGMVMKETFDAEADVRASASTLAATQAKADFLRQQLKLEAPTKIINEVGQRNALLNFLNERKSGLELERQRLLTKFGDDHILVKDMEQQISKIAELIASTEQEVKQSKTTGVNPVYEDMEKESATTSQLLEATKAKHDAQLAALERLKGKLRALQGAEAEYRRLTRDVQLEEESYRVLQRNSQEIQATEKLTSQGITSIAVVDPATPPIKPTGTRKSYILGGSFLGGLILGLALAFVSSALDSSVQTLRHVEHHLGSHVLASIQLAKISRKNPSSSAFENEGGFLGLSSQLEALAKQGHPRVFSMHGANRGAGCTTITAHLARSLGSTLGKRVLVLEVCNGPSALAPHFGLSTDGQSVDLMEGDVLSHAREINATLSVLTRGYFSSHSTTMEIAQQMEALAKNARMFEYVLIDTEPGVPGYISNGVEQGAHGAVVVIETGQTRRLALENISTQFNRSGIKVVGAVLNKRIFYVPDFIYRRV